MTLARPFSVGALQCHLLEAGRCRLDGGAMFGVVPRPLWEKRAPPDALHRIPLAMRCLLVRHPAGLVLIDTGLGDKEDPKFLELYGVENAGAHGPTQLEDALAEAGVRPDEVRFVINTHLHFDHAGGNTRRGEGAGAPPRLAFPNATYVVQRRELDFARHTNERTRASYLPPNFEPVAQAARWDTIDGDRPYLPGLELRVTPGHVPFHQSVVLRSGGATACFLGDVLPTVAHLPLPWIMGYDVEPLRTLESKRALLDEAVRERWTLIFEHDPTVAAATPVPDPRGRGLELTDLVTVGD